MPQFRLFAYFMLVSTLAVSCPRALNAEEAAEHGSLPGTKPLVWEGDVASRLVDGVDKFLLAETAKSTESRAGHFQRDLSSPEKYAASIEPNRRRLAHILGVRDPRVAFDAMELVGTTSESPLVGEGADYKVFAVRWPAFGDVHGEGLLLVPKEKPVADVVAIPHADQTPEMLAGLVEGAAAESQFARRLAESGCRVLVPAVVSRRVQQHGRAKLTDREYLYRSAYELGRTLTGYEVQKVLAAVDWFTKQAGENDPRIGVIGWGDGGMLALYAAALDPRIDAVVVSGYFDARENLWQEPIDRNVFGLLDQFGGAELASLVAPRTLIVEACRGPELKDAREQRQVHELDRHNQELLAESPEVRKAFFAKLDTGSLEAFEKTVPWYRQYFYDEVIGRFPYKPLPPNVRSRKTHDEPTWTGHEVVLDVFPDVIAHGILLLPKGIKPGEKRPVVVCQHGLEGRPTDVMAGGQTQYYSDFATRLAEQGYIVFAPQNLYIFQDRFRSLQRKANPIKKTLFSIIVPQHQQIVDWLSTLPEVDPARIAFYGLSYGGKSAMRIPPLVPNYCLSICSGDFNEWVLKNASTRDAFSYVWTGEYEIFEFDLGSTFNYAEMAALIAPRPFMVERGHFDGVGNDEYVAYEFAKVRFLYQARLGIGDRAEIEWFNGPHQIHGVGTFAFLRKHLGWPEQTGSGPGK
ncbi:MAG: dienelactone hydrolase family protein [Planctomycetia bacterium]|nr:dienelactone hydrolase family protein [Planctomycetia bacterium]